MADEPEEGFTVRDRRRFNAEPNPAASETTPAPAAPAPVQPTPSPAESVAAFAPAEEQDGAPFYGPGDDTGGGPEGEYGIPDIYSVLFEFLQVTRTHAALRLGLLPNPSTGKIERDLEQARVAIDTVIFLGKQIEQVIAPEERLPLQAMISELQMQYLQQTKRG